MWHRYYFAFKIYQLFDATHPKWTVALITLLTITNCTFGACVYGEVAAFAYSLPWWHGLPLLAVFFGAHQFATYYLHHIETRTVKGEWTWASKGIVGLYWLVTALVFNPRPASIGCEHWVCIWPHPPR